MLVGRLLPTSLRVEHYLALVTGRLENRVASSLQAPELWLQLGGVGLFASLTEEERLSFVWAFEREAFMYVRRFASGEFACRKG